MRVGDHSRYFSRCSSIWKSCEICTCQNFLFCTVVKGIGTMFQFLVTLINYYLLYVTYESDMFIDVQRRGDIELALWIKILGKGTI